MSLKRTLSGAVLAAAALAAVAPGVAHAGGTKDPAYNHPPTKSAPAPAPCVTDLTLKYTWAGRSRSAIWTNGSFGDYPSVLTITNDGKRSCAVESSGLELVARGDVKGSPVWCEPVGVTDFRLAPGQKRTITKWDKECLSKLQPLTFGTMTADGSSFIAEAILRQSGEIISSNNVTVTARVSGRSV